jgi:hypothetical protein
MPLVPPPETFTLITEVVSPKPDKTIWPVVAPPVLFAGIYRTRKFPGTVLVPGADIDSKASQDGADTVILVACPVESDIATSAVKLDELRLTVEGFTTMVTWANAWLLTAPNSKASIAKRLSLREFNEAS